MSKAQEWPQGRQMPGPWTVQNLQMPQPRDFPGTDLAGKCRAVAGGGGGRCAQVELTDAYTYPESWLVNIRADL